QERLRALVHQIQIRGPGPEVGLPLGGGLPRLAHRVLRHLPEIQRGVPGPALRRHRQRLPPPHQRDRPERVFYWPSLVQAVVPCPPTDHLLRQNDLDIGRVSVYHPSVREGLRL